MARADKWKLKSWYSVIAPKIFEEKKVGDIVGIDDESVLNRKIVTNLGSITGQLPHGYTIVKLRINEVKGKTAYTKLIGHELLRSYLRTLARRRMSLIDDVVKVSTKDGVDVVVKYAIITQNKVSGANRAAIRRIAKELVVDKGAKEDFVSFMQLMLFRKLSSQIYNKVKEILPIKRVEVIKSEVVEPKRSLVSTKPSAS